MILTSEKVEKMYGNGFHGSQGIFYVNNLMDAKKKLLKVKRTPNLTNCYGSSITR